AHLLRPADRAGRDDPGIQAPQAAHDPRDDRAPGGKGPADPAAADGAAAPRPLRPAGGIGAGGAGGRPGRVLRAGGRAVVDRPDSRAHGDRTAAFLVDRTARGALIPFPAAARNEMAPPPASDDAELLRAVIERDDRDAFAVLVRRHQSQV